MRSYLMILITLSLVSISCAQESGVTKESLDTKEKKVSYAIGKDIGTNIRLQGIDLTIDEFIQGVKDGIADSSLFTEEEITAILTEFQQEMIAKRDQQNKELGDKNIKEGEKFLAENEAKEGVITTESGLQYKVVKKGDGPKPTAADRVKVHYKGMFIDGKEFDSSYKRNEPITFALNGVIPGWTEALQLMSVGDKFELYIPYNLAYGANGKMPVIEPYKTLLFEVELLEIVK